MLWTLESMEPVDTEPADGWAGQWVLHRHRDTDGPHLDLRLETGGILGGLRIDGEALNPGVRAIEKAPHPLDWLTTDGPAQADGRGQWGWDTRKPERRILILDDGADRYRLVWRRLPPLPPDAHARLSEWCREHRLAPAELPGLCADGLRARQAALARCQGLAALIEGDRFDPNAWQILLEPLDLEALNRRLEALEAQLDRLHPPIPWTCPPDGPADPPASADPRALARAIALLRGSPAATPRQETAHPRE